MISKEFAKKVVNNQARGVERTITKSGNEYFADYVGFDTGDTRLPGVYVYRVDKQDPEYNVMVAVYRLGTGWYICG